MQAIILCGGLATRLGETTKTVPKVLLNIAGKTVLEWQIRLLKDANVKEVILASGHLHHVLYERVGTDYMGVRVQYAKEEKRLGTGGAIQNAMRYLNPSPFFVLNGDVLLANFSPREMLRKFRRGMAGLLLGIRVADIRSYGEILSDADGKITAFREKPSVCRAGYINGGVYLFNETVADTFPKDRDSFSIEQDVFPNVPNLYTLQPMPIGLILGSRSGLRTPANTSRMGFSMNLDIFRAYDIRGIFGVDFQPNDFFEIARAFASCFQPKTVALGHDVRESSPQLWQHVAKGLQAVGVDVLNIGRVSTDMLYFAAVHHQTDAGMIISASHNPAEYNGIKIVRQHAAPCPRTPVSLMFEMQLKAELYRQKRKPPPRIPSIY